MSKIEDLKNELEALKHKAWGSDRFGPTYSKGYWFGVFDTCRKLEKILDINIEIDPQKAEKLWSNRGSNQKVNDVEN